MSDTTQNDDAAEDSNRLTRAKALDELAEMGQRGDFDLLLDKRCYRP